MAGHPVYVVEQTECLGGNLARVDSTAPYLNSARDLLTERITRLREDPNISVLLNSRLKSLSGFIGNFSATIETNGTIAVPAGVGVGCKGIINPDSTQVEFLRGPLHFAAHTPRGRAGVGPRTALF